MDSDDPKPKLTDVVDSVVHLLGEVMSREAIAAVVEHYNGDLNQSIDTIMNMCDDKAPNIEQSHTPCIPIEQNIQPERENITVNQHMAIVAQNFNAPSTGRSEIERPSISYSGVSQSRGAFFKEATKKPTHDMWTLQERQIIDYHNKGSRTLILLRGVPGSGKSYLAKRLLRTMCPDAVFETHIFSTDDFFMVKEDYKYDRTRLSEAHAWNQKRVEKALLRGLSPVFVDNTNVEVWEMRPYVKYGVDNGYIIEVLEPNTPWAKRPNQLALKNIHKVPIRSIRRMLDNYRNNVSGLYLIRSFDLIYPPDKVPPVMRNIPHILSPNYTPQQSQPATKPSGQAKVTPIQAIPQTTAAKDQQEPSVNSTLTAFSSSECTPSEGEEKLCTSQGSTNTNVKHITIQELKKQLEEIEKLDQEWENGESWNENSEATACGISESKPLFTPQPPRNSKVNTDQTDKFLPSASNYNDWSNISMFMPAWNDYQDTNPQQSPNVRVETASHGTSVEFGDTDMNTKNLKILIGTPKDINFYYMGLNEEKIPERRMLDKSSMTNDHDHIAAETVRCKNEEKHFAAFRKLFKNVSKVELRDIFDKCVGDVNWAVDIVLDGMENNELQTVDNENYSDTEDLNDEQCECLAAYNIIPSINTQFSAKSPNINEATQETAARSVPKIKKEKTVLESSVQLKRQIEKNVVISDSHYSDHCLKIRKIRRGEVTDSRGDSIQEEAGTSTATPPNTVEIATESTLNTEADEDDSQTSSDDCERTVNVDLGPVFISELDKMFGRNDMTYPDNVTTRVNMPVSLLNEINALWMESLMHQFEQQSRQSEYMLRQDEEFARQLALKEEQLAQAGQEPAVPDLKEIMDMELALSIYKKEITAEWRNNEPNDLAARMTREKLYNLFPDVPPEILSELLMAHDNNFKDTVEVLLSSTDNAQILEQQNGVDKFIAKKEMERQKKILEEEKKALSEVEWPLLPKEVKVDISTVQEYREKASQFLAQRNLYYQKAQDFFRRDMTDVATYYSDVASMHTKKFEQANSLAAACLMQVHAGNSSDNATIDLHYLHVPEAKESLDLFLDTHIQKLRESQASSGPRFHNLFFITGRGRHSRAGPRIKPAVKRRLRERGIAFSERNPGLLASKVSAEDKMTHQLP